MAPSNNSSRSFQFSVIPASAAVGGTTICSRAWSEETSKKDKTHKASSVVFDERVRIRKTIHVNDFSDDEIDACWYSDSEFSEMKREVRFVVDLIEQGLLLTMNNNEDYCGNSQEYCSRGSECHVPDELRRRRKLKGAACAAILAEQALQSSEGSFDPDYIAEISMVGSFRSQAIAREAGLNDELAAALLY